MERFAASTLALAECLAVLLGCVLICVTIGAVLAVLQISPAERAELALEPVLREVAKPYLTLQAVVFIAAGAVMWRFRVRPDRGRERSDYFTAILTGVAAGLAAFLLSLLMGALLKLLGFPVQEQSWVLELLRDRKQVLGLAPWMVLIVPVSEEVFFRAYVFGTLSQRAGLAAGLVISSIMFAAVHFNPSGFFVYFGIGMVLAYVYRRTSNIAAPIAGHVVHNSLVLSALLLMPPG
jgi:membrane protease YdiL (CAAX protease family)